MTNLTDMDELSQLRGRLTVLEQAFKSYIEVSNRIRALEHKLGVTTSGVEVEKLPYAPKSNVGTKKLPKKAPEDPLLAKFKALSPEKQAELLKGGILLGSQTHN